MIKKISAGVVHELPPDLKKVLIADPKALAKWEDITPLARNEWICWTISVKQLKTRREHVEGFVVNLKKEFADRAVGQAAPTTKNQKYKNKKRANYLFFYLLNFVAQ